MSDTAQIASRLRVLVRSHNREREIDALLKAFLGVVFSLFVFGFIFWCAWFFGFFYAHYLGLQAWQFGAILAGLFLGVATWSAWYRVDPLAGLQRLSDRELLLTLISQVSPGILYFSPRHATAGAAVLLIGGPASILQGIGIWASRLRADELLIKDASSLLAGCKVNYPIEQIQNLAAALLLRKLNLIKAVPNGDSSALTLTEKGHTVLAKTASRTGKRSAAARAFKQKRP